MQLERLMRSATYAFEAELFNRIAKDLNPKTKALIDALLSVAEDDANGSAALGNKVGVVEATVYRVLAKVKES